MNNQLMAVPTIASVSPATGPASGQNIITITGTNFKTDHTDLVPVRVTVNGRISSRVFVHSTTQVKAIVPRYLAGNDSVQEYLLPVDVRVDNLDSNGNPIATENATLIDAYKYERPLLVLPAKRAPFDSVTRQFIGMLALEATRHTAMSTSVDYGEDGEVIPLKVEHPSIGIRARAERDHEWGQWDNIRERKAAGGGKFDVYRPAKSWMLTYDLILSARKDMEGWHLVDSVQDIPEAYPYLVVPADPDWIAGDNKYPLELSAEMAQISTPNDVDIVAFSTQLRVRGIRILHSYPVDSAYTVSAVIVTTTAL